MPLKRRFTAILCALVLLCTLLPSRASASTVYLMALNDKMCDLPNGLLPVYVNGSLYVPYTTFDNAATGVDLGVYYGLSQDNGTILSLYSRSGYLTFTVNKGLCVDDQGYRKDFNAIVRYGTIYVPLSGVCTFFGLRYAVMSTPDRGTLVRITNQNASVDDSTFLGYASQSMAYRYNNIIKSQEPPPTPPPRPTPVPPPQKPQPDQEPGHDRGAVWVYLAVDGDQAADSLPDSLSAGLPRLLFLFSPDTLPQHTALVRRLVAAGHSIGLKVDTTDPEEALAQLALGNELLRHIVRLRTRIAAAPYELTDRLTAEGWSCWIPNVGAGTLSGIRQELDKKRSLGRVTLPPSPSLINQLVRELREARYTLRQPLETEL